MVPTSLVCVKFEAKRIPGLTCDSKRCSGGGDFSFVSFQGFAKRYFDGDQFQNAVEVCAKGIIA